MESSKEKFEADLKWAREKYPEAVYDIPGEQVGDIIELEAN